MEFHSSHLSKGKAVPSERCSIKANARLVEVFQKTADGGHPYLFVEDEQGSPVGLLAAEDVLRRVTEPSPSEFMRWMDMPAESALQSRIQMPSNVDQHADHSTNEHVQVSRDGVLLGVITDTDVLISWRSIQRTLQTSQGDAITGLPNRKAFDQHLEAEITRGKQCHHSVAVVVVDLDYFKPINDQFGHAAGDAALHVVATRLRESLRSYDMVARFGGDEFAVVCSGCRPGEIDIVLRRLRENILSLQNTVGKSEPVPTVSVGAAVAHDLWNVNQAQIVAAADECLYAAKQAGRNCAYKMELGIEGRVRPLFVEDLYSHSAQPSDVNIESERYQTNAC